MNLTSLRERIKNLTDYSPELQQFNDQLDQLINDAYYEIWTYKRWNFANKIKPIRFYPDITPTRDTENSAGAPVNLSIAKGFRKVTFSFPLDRLIPEIYEGQPIEIEGNEFIISRVENFSSLILDREYKGDTLVDSTNWKIKKRTYDLPSDCLELLYCGYRDAPHNELPVWGKMSGLMPRSEESVDLRIDYTREKAEAYIPMPSPYIMPAERIDLDLGGSGTLTAGFYELCWAFEKEGKVGALSEPSTFEIQEDNTAIDIKFLTHDDQLIQCDPYEPTDNFPSQWEGYRKVLFFNKNIDPSTGERIGLPCWIAVTKGGTRASGVYLEPVVVPDTSGTYSITNPDQLNSGSERYIEIDGQYQSIRPYPRHDGWDVYNEQQKFGEIITDFAERYSMPLIRYYKKPSTLLLSTDSPEMPFEFHQLIVYRALENIYYKLGNTAMAKNYEGKIEKEMKNLQKRYVDKIDFVAQKGQFSMKPRGIVNDVSQLKWRG